MNASTRKNSGGRLSIATLCLGALLLLVVYSSTASAESIVSCPTGMKYENQLCHQPCRDNYIEDGLLCRRECSSGFTWNGFVCSKWYGLTTYYPDSYSRTTSNPTYCSTSSFTRKISSSTSPETFTMIVSSDSQYPWWRGANDSNCSSEECVKEKGEQTNREQIQAMNNVINTSHSSNGNTISALWPSTSNVLASRRGGAISEPKGVILNGDLTAFWHDWQAEKYMDLYHRNDADPNNTSNLKLNLYPGLGNHDIANNRGDCWWVRNFEYISYGANGCAKNAAHYIKKMVSCNLVSNFPSSSMTSYDDGSLAYSWDIGRYHFVQLHNFPTYTYPEIGLGSSIEWLRQDLQRAYDAGKRSVINLHDYGEHMSSYNADFLGAISGKNVIAVFAGHLHSQNGYVGSVAQTQIPLFRSGAAEYNTFLLVEFGRNHMTVGVIDSTGGSPRFMNPSSSYKLKTIEFSSP